MKLLRISSVLAVALLLVSLVVGCRPTPTPTAPPTAAPTAAPTGRGSRALQSRLRPP